MGMRMKLEMGHRLGFIESSTGTSNDLLSQYWAHGSPRRRAKKRGRTNIFLLGSSLVMKMKGLMRLSRLRHPSEPRASTWRRPSILARRSRQAAWRSGFLIRKFSRADR